MGDCPGCCRIFQQSLPSRVPVAPSFQLVTNKNVFKHFQMFPGTVWGGGESELNDNHRISHIMWCKAMGQPVIQESSRPVPLDFLYLVLQLPTGTVVEEGPVGSGPRIVTAAAVKAMSSGL